MEIHIARDGKQFGPYPQEEVERQLAAGTLLPTDLAWAEGAAGWVPLASFPGLVTQPPALGTMSPLRSLGQAGPSGGAMMSEPPKTSGAALASLICGILSIILCLPIIMSIPAVICGHVARGRIRESNGRLTGDGMAVAGLILGYLGGVVLLAIIPILAGIAVPVFQEVQLRGKETISLSNAKQISVACQAYASDHEGAFPPNLGDLSPKYLPNRQVLSDSLSPGESIGYDYFGGKDSDPADKVLLISKFKDRHGKRIVGHVNGFVSLQVPPANLPAPTR